LINFLGLVQNENMKIYRRPGTWVMYSILIAVLLIIGLFTKFVLEDPPNANWQERLIAQNLSMQLTVEEAAMPGPVIEHFEREIKLNEYRIEQNIPPIETKSFWGYITSTVNLISVVTMFTIIVAAGIVAGEFSWGTIKLLLIRPVSRAKILFSKYVATFIFALLMLFSLFLFSVVFGGVIFGFSSIAQPHLVFSGGEVIERNMFSYILMLYSLSSVELLMMVTFAFMISTVFRSSSLAIGLALFLMFTGTQLVQMLSQYEWVKYILFANTYLVQYIEGTPIVEGMTMTFSLVMLTIYFVIFNILSWMIFQKRDVAA
jgi:ABC-2 type transport system permease protein